MTVAADHAMMERGEAVPPAPDLALEVQRKAGIYALGAQTESEFDETVETLRRGMERLDKIIATVLVEGVDYEEPKYGDSYVDRATGQKRKKKNLLLAGAEKLAFVARLVPTFDIERPYGPDGAPPVHYVVKCNLHMGSEQGPVVAQGVGSCNSFETKYRYRKGSRVCPNCNREGTVRKSNYEYQETGKKGWWCSNDDCKAQFAPDDPAIVKQEVGRIDNPDPWDLDNTILKMGKTRAFRDAVKTATGGSARLTQDLEDLPPRSGAVEIEHEESEGPAGSKPETPERSDASDGGSSSSPDPSTLSTVDLMNDVLARATRLKKSLADIFALVGVIRGDNSKKPRALTECTPEELQGVIRAWSE